MNCMEVWGGSGPTNQHFARPGLDIWISSRSPGCPDSAAGDLHLLSSCASGRITRMLLADVCSVGGLFPRIAGQLRDLMMRNVNSSRQTRLVRHMSRRLSQAAQQGDFASVMLATYFAPTRSLTICNAGYPPPLLYRGARREWLSLKQCRFKRFCGSVPLGVVDYGEYQLFNISLDVGDMVLGYSNALTECRRPDGRLLGVDGLVARLRRLDPHQPAGVVAGLLSCVDNGPADNLAADDATLLLCRASNTRVAWSDNLLAPLRLLRSVSDKTNLL